MVRILWVGLINLIHYRCFSCFSFLKFYLILFYYAIRMGCWRYDLHHLAAYLIFVTYRHLIAVNLSTLFSTLVIFSDIYYVVHLIGQLIDNLIFLFRILNCSHLIFWNFIGFLIWHLLLIHAFICTTHGSSHRLFKIVCSHISFWEILIIFLLSIEILIVFGAQILSRYDISSLR